MNATRRKSGSTERAKRAAELQERLVEQVETLRDSGEWMRFLRACKSFRKYSFSNVMLIAMQKPGATYVAGYRAWLELGRQVRKGERSIGIYGFSRREVEPKTEAEEPTYRITYPVVSVFDVSQTDPIQEDAFQPDVVSNTDATTEPTEIYNRVHDYLVGQGWTVTRQAIFGETQGYTTTDGSKQIVVERHLGTAHAAYVLLHEAAHAHMHADMSGEDYRNHRGIAETEADSVAYILGGLLGLDTSSASVHYIATWARGDADLIRETATRVLAAVNTLAEGLQIPPQTP